MFDDTASDEWVCDERPRSDTISDLMLEERDDRLNRWGRENDELKGKLEALNEAHGSRKKRLERQLNEARLTQERAYARHDDIVDKGEEGDWPTALVELEEVTQCLDMIKRKMEEEDFTYERKKMELEEGHMQRCKRRSLESEEEPQEDLDEAMKAEDFLEIDEEEEEGKGEEDEDEDGDGEGKELQEGPIDEHDRRTGDDHSSDSVSTILADGISKMDINSQQRHHVPPLSPHKNRFAPLADLGSSSSSLPASPNHTGTSPIPEPSSLPTSSPPSTPISHTAPVRGDIQSPTCATESPPPVEPSFASPHSSLFPEPPTSSHSSPAPALEQPTEIADQTCSWHEVILPLRCNTNTSNSDNDRTPDPCHIITTPHTPVKATTTITISNAHGNDDNDEEGLYKPATPPHHHRTTDTSNDSVTSVTRGTNVHDNPDGREHFCTLSDGTARWVPTQVIADPERGGRVHEFEEMRRRDGEGRRGSRGLGRQKRNDGEREEAVEVEEQQSQQETASPGSGGGEDEDQLARNDAAVPRSGEQGRPDHDVVSWTASGASSRTLTPMPSPTEAVLSEGSFGFDNAMDGDAVEAESHENDKEEAEEEEEEDGMEEQELPEEVESEAARARGKSFSEAAQAGQAAQEKKTKNQQEEQSPRQALETSIDNSASTQQDVVLTGRSGKELVLRTSKS